MNFLSISRNAVEEYAETTCVLLREADGEFEVEDYGFSLAGDAADYGEDA